MKVLHIYRTPPDEPLVSLARVPENPEIITFSLNEKTADYDRLLDLIFECDQVITWP